MNDSTLNDSYEPKLSPIKCSVVVSFGYYFFLLFVCSLLLNTYLIHKLKNKRKRPMIKLVLAITFVSLLATITHYPLEIGSLFSCKWIYKKLGCYVSGFIMFSTGSIHILLIVSISLVRLYVTVNSVNSLKLTSKKINILILLCFHIGISMPAMPFFGLSKYSIDTTALSCTIKSNLEVSKEKTYNLTAVVILYVIPLLIVICSNVYQAKLLNSKLKFDGNIKSIRKHAIERKTFIGIFIYTSLFFIAWTPFSIIFITETFFDFIFIPPIYSLIASLFAKSSMVSCSLYFFYFSYKAEKKDAKYKLFIQSHNSNSISFQRFKSTNNPINN